MLVKTFGSTVQGVNAVTVTIEVNTGGGGELKGYIVGLPDNAVKESWQRIQTAIRHNGFYMPRTNVVINLAPADIRKEGTSFDLPMAIGILGATGQINEESLEK